MHIERITKKYLTRKILGDCDNLNYSADHIAKLLKLYIQLDDYDLELSISVEEWKEISEILNRLADGLTKT